MSGYIPKEQLDAYRRWQIDSFDPPKPEPVRPPPPPPEDDNGSELVTGVALPTAEDIERIHIEAQQTGYETGFAEGREEGYRQGMEVAQAEAQRIASLADNVEAALADLDQSVAEDLLALALEVAGQVLRGTIRARPEALLPIVREALAALPLHHGHVALHVNPADGEMVREHFGEQFMHSGWRIVDDREVLRGGCLVHAGSSEVDASLPTRWKRVLETIGANPADWLDQP